jgi:uncharacterized protein (TIGR02270 family)
VVANTLVRSAAQTGLMRGRIPVVVDQHVHDAASLATTRLRLVDAAHVNLKLLDRIDERIAAHLDGIILDGPSGIGIALAELETGGKAECFLLAALGLASGNAALLEHVRRMSEATVDCTGGLLAAYGWSEPRLLRAEVQGLLRSSHDFDRYLGIAACALHRLDPGLTSARRFEDDSAIVRARAWRTAGEIGKRELVSTAAAAMVDDDPACRFWAAWSAVLLGDTQNALEMLAGVAAVPGPFRARAFQLTLQAKSVERARDWLSRIGRDGADRRWLIRGLGLTGDPAFVPWLIDQMADIQATRIAGEAVSLITGLNLARLDLEVKPPEDFDSGPNDDPNDPNVEMDEDDGLPWPDASKLQAWWHANSQRFHPGIRYFMGQPPSRDQCLQVLRQGFQRQRVVAALHLSLLHPGTPLFECRAPARRQQRLLAETI